MALCLLRFVHTSFLSPGWLQHELQHSYCSVAWVVVPVSWQLASHRRAAASSSRACLAGCTVRPDAMYRPATFASHKTPHSSPLLTATHAMHIMSTQHKRMVRRSTATYARLLVGQCPVCRNAAWQWSTRSGALRMHAHAHLVRRGGGSEEEGVHRTGGGHEQPGRQGSHDRSQDWLHGRTPHVRACDPVARQLRVDQAGVDRHSQTWLLPSVPVGAKFLTAQHHLSTP